MKAEQVQALKKSRKTFIVVFLSTPPINQKKVSELWGGCCKHIRLDILRLDIARWVRVDAWNSLINYPLLDRLWTYWLLRSWCESSISANTPVLNVRQLHVGRTSVLVTSSHMRSTTSRILQVRQQTSRSCWACTEGNFSPSMHGTLLDQRVFESLVHKCLPVLYEHFTAVDVQLSVASLPWFLSLWVVVLSYSTDDVTYFVLQVH